MRDLQSISANIIKTDETMEINEERNSSRKYAVRVVEKLRGKIMEYNGEYFEISGDKADEVEEEDSD